MQGVGCRGRGAGGRWRGLARAEGATEATIETAVAPPEPKLPIELGSLPYVVVRQGMIIMPGVPNRSSPATAAINKLIAAGATQDKIIFVLVLRSDL